VVFVPPAETYRQSGICAKPSGPNSAEIALLMHLKRRFSIATFIINAPVKYDKQGTAYRA